MASEINCTEGSVAEPEKQPDLGVDDWLNHTLADAVRRFPELGFFFLAVEGQGEVEVSAASNIDRDNLNGVLEAYVQDDHPTVYTSIKGSAH